ncbi:MAG: DUF2269 family protein [Chloroflexota bacterium]|nr:MAG: DUF2269 family protein [Chloroflexota bacterium]
MQWLILLKLVHVLAAIVAVGANVTYGFWLRLAGRDRERLTFTISSIHWLDMRLANPAYGLLLITGVLMVAGGLYSFQTGWIAVSSVLYVLAVVIGIVLYAPAIRRQLAEARADPNSAAYDAAAARSNQLGIVTLVIVVVIVILMVTKPF